jgi:hypothetical protein
MRVTMPAFQYSLQANVANYEATEDLQENKHASV